jgi:hypothetical protein
VLFDDLWRLLDVNLLNDPSNVAIATHRATATRAGIKGVGLEMRDLFRREWVSLVLGVPRLAADGTLGGSILGGGLGLDDVRGWGLRRSRRILLRRGQLLTHLGNLGLQSVDTGLQLPAVRAFRLGGLAHTTHPIPDAKIDISHRERLRTPVEKNPGFGLDIGIERDGIGPGSRSDHASSIGIGSVFMRERLLWVSVFQISDRAPDDRGRSRGEERLLGSLRSW